MIDDGHVRMRCCLWLLGWLCPRFFHSSTETDLVRVCDFWQRKSRLVVVQNGIDSEYVQIGTTSGQIVEVTALITSLSKA